MRSRHLSGCELVGVKLRCAREDNSPALFVALWEWEQVTAVDDVGQRWVIDVELLEPIRKELTDGQILLEKFACHWHRVLLGS